MEKIARASFGYTIFGLLGGFYYRTLTRVYKFDRAYPTQLRLFHTHTFALGSTFFLSLLVLEKNFHLTRQKGYKAFYVPYNIGIGITLTMMLVKGTMTVVGCEAQESRLFSWAAGLGHTLTAFGLYKFHQIIMAAIRDEKKDGEDKKDTA
ncbi:hypothetical protein AGDE_13865 [Angomonas deanei]|uniref:Uncharacterized protein n=1 Tax=Angomonas deanei TaxID=59799 RepID=A0A7G2CHH6_9TRYP|nr:hypothetical protein AGDE_13865 [Angomonas deanei]CAD2219206.1 Protein of unknown function (DUF2871), putative [Angomonas deanei]|eukprot:EPY21657.1 hypothetical protein AGDE_13865 [Angomonas deanei]